MSDLTENDLTNLQGSLNIIITEINKLLDLFPPSERGLRKRALQIRKSAGEMAWEATRITPAEYMR